MTFYEAAIQVLEREGKPLHVNAITERAIKENLLSHVGKSPEETMQSRLLAMARRKADRKIVATAAQTYGLVEWGVAEDPAALELAPELPKEEPPLRPRERHPIPSPDKVRVAGRTERRKGRRDEEWEERKKRRKFPPLPEVAFEILSAAPGPMSAVDIAAAARDRDLVGEDLGAEMLLNALREDNRRRTEAGRRAAFNIAPNNEVSLEKGVAVETTAEIAPALIGGEERTVLPVRLIATAQDLRRQTARAIRKKLAELDGFGLEKACMPLLEQNGFREMRVAKRGKEGPVLTGRKREGLADLRYAVRLIRGGREITSRDLEEIRRDVNHLSAQIGVLVSPNEVSRDVRQEVSNPKHAPVILLCGDALGDRFLEKKLGATSTMVEIFDVDEAYFRSAKEKGAVEEKEREQRRRDRDGQPGGEGREPREGRERNRDRGQQGQGQQQAQAAGQESAPRTTGEIPVQQIQGQGTEQAAQTQGTGAETQAQQATSVQAPVLDEKALAARAEEAKLRLQAHEAIEAAEIKARAARTA